MVSNEVTGCCHVDRSYNNHVLKVLHRFNGLNIGVTSHLTTGRKNRAALIQLTRHYAKSERKTKLLY